MRFHAPRRRKIFARTEIHRNGLLLKDENLQSAHHYDGQCFLLMSQLCRHLRSHRKEKKEPGGKCPIRTF
jgi:hypothetical protein